VTTPTKQKDYSNYFVILIALIAIAVGVYVNSERKDEKRYQEIKGEYNQAVKKLDNMEW